MVEAKVRVWWKIAVFYALTMGLSACFDAGDRLAPGNMIYLTGAMWCPALAAFATKALFREKIRELGWHWDSRGNQRLGYILPLVYAVPAYLVIWMTGLGKWYDTDYVRKVAQDLGWSTHHDGVVIGGFILLFATVGFIPKASRALGEEIGWRGFLVPELAKVVSFRAVGVISGLMWGLWHFPSIIWGGYHGETPTWYALVCFTCMIVSCGVLAAWLTLRSGSLWPAVFFHGSHNLFVQLILTPMTRNAGPTPWLIDEFGAGLALTTTILDLLVSLHPRLTVSSSTAKSTWLPSP
jgi:membrane protease YdiL (CAAX protease family)